MKALVITIVLFLSWSQHISRKALFESGEKIRGFLQPSGRGFFLVWLAWEMEG
jgi:hypothetical protein